MAIAAPLAIIGGIAAVGGTALAIRQQSKAAKKAKKREEVISMRSRRAAIREAQLKKARALATAQAAGAAGSSAEAGGIQSISSRLGEKLGFASQVSNLNQGIASAQQSASLFSGIAGAGTQIFGAVGGFGALPNLPSSGGGQAAPASGLGAPSRSNIFGTNGAV